LPTGCTVTPKYKINRESSWQTGTAAVAGATEARLNINKRYKESQVGFDVVCTTGTPHISAWSILLITLGKRRLMEDVVYRNVPLDRALLPDPAATLYCLPRTSLTLG
jgi:hypothetical protein